MNTFDKTVNIFLAEDWKSATAAGLLGLGTLGGMQAQAQAEPAQPALISKQAQEVVSMSKLLNAISTVESHGDLKAIGDKGKAKGVLQIWKSVVDDVNRVYKTNYVHDDAFDLAKARQIASKYLTYWGKQYQKKTEKAPTYEVLARVWNGGPGGYKKPATVEYWNKVKNEL